MVFHPAGSSLLKMDTLWSQRDKKHMQWYAVKLWHLNIANLLWRSPKSAKKIFPTQLHNHQLPELVIQGRMNLCSHVVSTKFLPYSLLLWQESRLSRLGDVYKLLMSNFGELVNCSLSFLFLVRVTPSVLFCHCSLKVQCVVASEMLFCIPWL